MDSKDKAMKFLQQLSPEKQALLAQRLREKRTVKNDEVHTHATMVTGPVPVMPRLIVDYAHQQPQSWWKAMDKLIEIPRLLHPALVAEAVQHLIAQHDTLRLRLHKEQDDYSLFLVAAENQAFHERDVSHLAPSQQDDEMEMAKKTFWDRINLETGPLFQVIFFNLGPARLPRLLIILHHFAVDGYSIGVLLNDFEIACKQLVMGQPVKLPAKSTSIKQWAERMQAYACSHESSAEIDYWKSRPWADVRPTPVDHPEVYQSATAHLTGTLSFEETQDLLLKVPVAYHVRLWDILLAACALTYARYTQLKTLAIVILHHGRSLAIDNLDLFRTAGCLYTCYPLLLQIDAATFLENPSKVLQMVADAREQVPYGGATWYWVSYYSDEKYLAWRENIKIEENVVFNYLGENKATTPVLSEVFREVEHPAKEDSIAHLHDTAGKVQHSCETIIESGQLKVVWEYFSARNDKSTIEYLVQDYLSTLRWLIKMADKQNT